MQWVWKNLVYFFQSPNTPGEEAMGQKTDIPIQLDSHTRATLAGWLRRPKTPLGLARRAQALLLLDQGEPYAATARRVGLSERHVRKWAYRFRAEGLTGLLDRQRPERMPRVSTRRRG
jgi:hypothetical protein